jgi:quinol-cytochrome oxidoreductase complex cytochrome b subunit
MKREERGLLNWLSSRINVTELFSFLTSFGLFNREVDTRKPLREALDEALQKPAPSYGRWPRVLGLYSLILLVFEIVTGGMLALYYVPTPHGAYDSLLVILQEVPFGWLVHQIHFWGAQLLLAVLIIRLFRFFFRQIYRKPRELVWICAGAMLMVCMHADLTGRLLKWTSVSYWSGVRVLETLSTVPIYGWFLKIVIGGGEISELTLIRYYFLHIAILPLLMLALIYLHFSTVRHVGLTDVGHDSSAAGATFYRNHLANLAIVLAMILGVLVTLAVLLPLPFHGRADLLATVPGVRPPWYLLGPFGLRELSSSLISRWVGGTILFLLAIGFLGMPFFEKGLPRALRRPILVTMGSVTLLIWILLSFYGARVA